MIDESLFPRAGAIAGDFRVPDSEGVVRSLSELTAEGPLVLLFYRGHW